MDLIIRKTTIYKLGIAGDRIKTDPLAEQSGVTANNGSRKL